MDIETTILHSGAFLDREDNAIRVIFYKKDKPAPEPPETEYPDRPIPDPVDPINPGNPGNPTVSISPNNKFIVNSDSRTLSVTIWSDGGDAVMGDPDKDWVTVRLHSVENNRYNYSLTIAQNRYSAYRFCSIPVWVEGYGTTSRKTITIQQKPGQDDDLGKA